MNSKSNLYNSYLNFSTNFLRVCNPELTKKSSRTINSDGMVLTVEHIRDAFKGLRECVDIIHSNPKLSYDPVTFFINDLFQQIFTQMEEQNFPLMIEVKEPNKKIDIRDKFVGLIRKIETFDLLDLNLENSELTKNYWIESDEKFEKKINFLGIPDEITTYIRALTSIYNEEFSSAYSKDVTNKDNKLTNSLKLISDIKNDLRLVFDNEFKYIRGMCIYILFVIVIPTHSNQRVN
ncbi:hypothetical protein RJG79_11525 [Mycoplasmatota bacterium WC44]